MAAKKCLQDIEGELRHFYNDRLNEMEDTPEGPQAKYLHYNHYFESIMCGDARGEANQALLVTGMEALYREIIQVAPPSAETSTTLVDSLPPTPTEEAPARFTVMLWKLPFHTKGFIRGATNAKHTLENMCTFIMKGNPTFTYPIEVKPTFGGLNGGRSPLLHGGKGGVGRGGAEKRGKGAGRPRNNSQKTSLERAHSSESFRGPRQLTSHLHQPP